METNEGLKKLIEISEEQTRHLASIKANMRFFMILTVAGLVLWGLALLNAWYNNVG
jgi:hypothetical protein